MLGYGYYSIRPLHRLDQVLYDDSANGYVAMSLKTITESESGLSMADHWTITYTAGNYLIKNHLSGECLYPMNGATTALNHATTVAYNSTTDRGLFWNFVPVSPAPVALLLYDANLDACLTSSYETTVPTKTIGLGRTYTLAEIGFVLSVCYTDSTNHYVTWSSSNTSVATVNSSTGAVTPVSMGETTITARRTINGNLFSVSYRLNVFDVPISGWELEYEPELWNNTSVQGYTNCYAYAINNQIDPVNDDFGCGTSYWNIQQPGEFYNGNRGTSPEFSTVGYMSNPSLIVTAVEKDFQKYNEIFGTNLQFIALDSKYEACPQGTYKVALVVGYDDYHWYRQDSDGYWSHKPGIGQVKRTDDNGNLITDPQTAARSYYPTFVGYFAVSLWNHLYTTATNTSLETSTIIRTSTIATASVQSIQIGMSIDEVIGILGGHGESIGSGTIIERYSTHEGNIITIAYAIDTEGVFRVSNIINGGMEYENQ